MTNPADQTKTTTIPQSYKCRTFFCDSVLLLQRPRVLIGREILSAINYLLVMCARMGAPIN